MPSQHQDADGTHDEVIVAAVRDQTHILLGRTIGFSEEEWAQPSRLPGWTRSHVAAHLVQNAKDLTGRARGKGPESPADEAQRTHALELAALAGGLELQIDLDTSAGELDEALTHLEGDSDIPMTRLYEVVLHTFDLMPGDEELQLDADVANDLLAFRIGRLDDADLPRLLILSHEGLEVRLGPEGGDPVRVTGPAADLLIWLARGVVTDRVGGAVPLDRIH